ncbi:MAG: ATP-binding cassette domain-containing protein, partial [Chloroflexi bacterium]|nr:ATP-binding cassette domain-containing protein [Chloroflexota bacterium]
MSNDQPFLLEVQNLNVNYGGIRALRSVNMHIIAVEIISVIGANGAGKSTLLKTLAGVKESAAGSIIFNGKPLPKEANKIVKSGIALAPEGRRIFAPLTVLENLKLGAYTRSDAAE